MTDKYSWAWWLMTADRQSTFYHTKDNPYIGNTHLFSVQGRALPGTPPCCEQQQCLQKLSVAPLHAQSVLHSFFIFGMLCMYVLLNIAVVGTFEYSLNSFGIVLYLN